jgi:signal transduction histidine kinase
VSRDRLTPGDNFKSHGWEGRRDVVGRAGHGGFRRPFNPHARPPRRSVLLPLLRAPARPCIRVYAAAVSRVVPMHRSSARWRARVASNPLLVDALIALGLTLFSLLSVAGRAPGIGNSDPLSVSLLMLQTLPLVLRRRYPLGVLIVITIATVGHGILATGPTLNSTVGGLVAVYTVAELCDRRQSAAALVGVGVSVGALIIGKGGVPGGLSSLIQSELVIVIVWLLGSWSRERREHLDVAEKRALLAEREREVQAERAVAEERTRIARELHDVIAHHVSVIVIQAGAGLRSIDRRPAEARGALVAIDENGRRALADMRRMLGVLGRSETPASESGTIVPGTDPTDGLAPMPSMDRLGELLEHVRAAGMPVELAVTGDPRPLDPGVELSAYRIIQEALTNSLKHARGARARVDVRYEPAALEVEVQDDGGQAARDGNRAAVPAGTGHGLIGMRERAALFGGRLEAGPVGRGFRVAAWLPLEPQPGNAG